MRLVLAAALLVGSVGSAHAAVEARTIRTKVDRISSDGEFNGCSLEFAAMFEDYTYKNGGVVVVNGSISSNLVEKDGQAYVMTALKVVPTDMTMANGNVSANSFVPAAIWMLDANEMPNRQSLVNSYESDTGGRFSVFAFDDSWASIQERIANTKSLGVAFNRVVGGQDIRLSIDLSMLRDEKGNDVGRSSTTVRDWMDCNLALFKVVEKKLSRQK